MNKLVQFVSVSIIVLFLCGYYFYFPEKSYTESVNSAAEISSEDKNSLTSSSGSSDLNQSDNESIISGINSPEKTASDSTILHTFTGYEAGDDFGWSLSDSGDVNNDGYDDIIIGAPKNDAGGTDAGRVYIYFGADRDSMNYIADVILTGEAANNFFGTSVASAGDVNGDGYADVIVGAYGYSSYTGRAYIYYGGSSMNNVADVILTGVALNNFFGYSVSGAGNVNGDGYSDVIVGAYGISLGNGSAYIYYGGAGMNNIADVILTENAYGANFGISVSCAGDLNADGYSDVIIGGDKGTINSGIAFIYYGSASMDNVYDVIFSGGFVPNIHFGISVSRAGDVNGDGYSDVIVGANGYNSNTGRAYIYYGGVSMDNVADVILTGEAQGDLFGTSVAAAGKVNLKGGFADVVVGAPGHSGNKGRAYVFYSDSTFFDNIPDDTLDGAAANDNFGQCVAGAGDIDDDDVAEILVGAYGNDAGGSNAGSASSYKVSLFPVGLNGKFRFSTISRAYDWMYQSFSPWDQIIEIKSWYKGIFEPDHIEMSSVGSWNTFTIRPAGGTTSMVFISGTVVNGYIFDIGSSDVIFDGRPGGIGSDSYLNIHNNATGGGCINISGDAIIRYVVCGLDYLGGTAINLNSNNNLIENSTTVNGDAGIKIVSGTNNIIKNIRILECGSSGIILGDNSSNNSVQDNFIQPDYSRTNHFAGIVNYSDGINVITRNKIVGASGRQVTGIFNNPLSTSVTYIYNNFISFSSVTNNSKGIYNIPANGSQTYIIYNTVYMNHGIGLFEDGLSSLNFVFNNIFINEGTGINEYCRYNVYGIAINSNYNCYWQTNLSHVKNGTITYSNICDYRAALINSFNREQNSIFKNVNFVNKAAGDLHLASPSIQDADLLGTYFTGSLTDIDNQVRSLGAPYMGADESIAFTAVTTVNPGGVNFPSLNSAFSSINKNLGGQYSGQNVEVIINQSTVEQYTSTLKGNIFSTCVIRPSANVTVTAGNGICLTSSDLIVMDGADNVIIDGIGTSGLSLTFTNASSGTSNSCIKLKNGSVNNTIRNINCNGLLSATQGYVIYLAETGNNNNVIENSIINGGATGIAAFTSSLINQGSVIKNNVIKNCATSGIYIGYGTKDNIVLNNELYNDVSSLNCNTQYKAIYCEAEGNNDISNNKIHNLSFSTGCTFLSGISPSRAGTSATTYKISNNFISFAENVKEVVGIYCSYNTLSYTANIYFNSVYIGGSHGLSQSIGIFNEIPASGSVINQFNNISINDRAEEKDYSFLNQPFSGVIINADYNCYLPVVRWETGNYYNITNYKSAVYPNEQHSIFKNVNFVSKNTGNLHLAGSSIGDLDLAGTPIAGITQDIDIQTRNPNLPYKGADESSAFIFLSLKAFLQGQSCDENVTVEFRSGLNPNTILKTQDVPLRTNGIAAVSTTGISLPSNVYIVLKHKNSLETWSKLTTITSGALTYDFTTPIVSPLNAYCDNERIYNGKAALYRGDFNQDGVIDVEDFNRINNDNYNFAEGNLITDFNCDGYVDVADISIMSNSSSQYYPIIVSNPDNITPHAYINRPLDPSTAYPQSCDVTP